MNNPFRPVSIDQCKDAGYALILVLLIIQLSTGHLWLSSLAAFVTLMVMIRPSLISPFASFWYGLAEIMGGFMSRVILTILFFALVTPMGLIRRAMGKDSLMLKRFGHGQESVLIERNHTVTASDLEAPY